MIDVAENQAVSDRTIAIDSNTKTRQREASAAECNEPGARVGSNVGIVASGSPGLNRVDGGCTVEANVTSLIAHGIELADRFIGPDLIDFNPLRGVA
jgi:hypothetical protein